MDLLIDYAGWLVAMGVLVLCSAFFSSSEAALFYLSRPERRRLAAGNRPQRMAAGLLADPDRLMTAVLFGNLAVNLAYFTIASITSFELEEDLRIAESWRTTAAGSFAVGSLLVIIVLSEMLPKSLAVLQPGRLAALVAIPLAATIRLLSPVLRLANLPSRRLFRPRFRVPWKKSAIDV